MRYFSYSGAQQTIEDHSISTNCWPHVHLSAEKCTQTSSQFSGYMWSSHLFRVRFWLLILPIISYSNFVQCWLVLSHSLAENSSPLGIESTKHHVAYHDFKQYALNRAPPIFMVNNIDNNNNNNNNNNNSNSNNNFGYKQSIEGLRLLTSSIFLYRKRWTSVMWSARQNSHRLLTF